MPYARITPEQILALKQRLDLREIASRYTDLRGGREKYGPCPNCGGTDRFHCTQQMWMCRSCHPPVPGKRADVLDLIVFLGLAHDFREAYEIASTWANTIPSSVRPGFVSETAPLDPIEWQQRAQREVQQCRQRLLSKEGYRGRTYLSRRGLVPSTWEAAQLGLARRRDADGNWGWAVTIPWLTRNEIVTAIQYRFLEPQGQRYTRFSYGGHYGETLLYTLPSKGSSTLVVCEGEFNAISVWQATSSEYDAISIGSQNMTQKTLEALRAHAQGFRHVLVWADEKNVTAAVLRALGGRGEGIMADGDANELLQQGRLRQVFKA